MSSIDFNDSEVSKYLDYANLARSRGLEPITIEQYYYEISKDEESDQKDAVDENGTEDNKLLGYANQGGGSKRNNNESKKISSKSSAIVSKDSISNGNNGRLTSQGNGLVATGVEIASDLATELANYYGPRILDYAFGKGKDFIDDLVKNMKTSRGRSSDEGGSFSDMAKAYGVSSSPMNVNAISYTPDPLEVRLSTGIPIHGYGRLILDPDVTNTYMHLTGAELKLPTVYTYATNPIGYYINTVAMPRFIDACQAKVNFSITSQVTTTNVVTYYNDIMDALAKYYFMASVLSYNTNPFNRNTAMASLRSMIDAEDINVFYILGEALRNVPVPKRINDLVFYLNQNFTESSMPASAIIKFIPFTFDTPTTVTGDKQFENINFASQMRTAIDALGSTTTKQMAAILARVEPNWMIPKLKDAPIVPLHDENFSTIFANAPYNMYLSTSSTPGTTYGPSIDSSGNAVYFSAANNLDGAAFALCSLYNSSSPTSSTPLVPGMLAVVNSLQATSQPINRFSYCYSETNSNIGWYSPAISIPVYECRPETNKVASGRVYTYRSNGFETVDGVNIQSIIQSCYNLIDYIFGFAELAPQMTASEQRFTGINRGSRGPVKGKDKGKRYGNTNKQSNTAGAVADKAKDNKAETEGK